MGIHRGDDGVECIVLKPGEKVSLREVMETLNSIPTIDLVPVVRCKDCQYCRLLNDGVSFECTSWEMDFYAPEYSVSTYYCADGKRKET